MPEEDNSLDEVMHPDGSTRSCFAPTDSEDDEPSRPRIACSKCGKPTSFDPTYGDLCYRCCRADNE